VVLMGLFKRRRPEPDVVSEVERGVTWPGYPMTPGMSPPYSAAGVEVSTQAALRNAAVWACQRVLVSTVSKLPVDVIRYRDGAREVVSAQPPIVKRPSSRVSRRGWVAQNVRSALCSGNIYGKVVATDPLMRPTQIETIHPDSVTWQVRGGEEVPFVNGAEQVLWPLGDFWHVPASQFLMPGSRVAMSPIEMARTSIGTGIAAERFGAQFFGDGGHPSAALYVDQVIDASQAADIKRSFVEATRGTREPAVFGSGIRYEKLQINPDDSQFIELLQFEVIQACRWWGVPPSMAYGAISGQAVTYSNITQDDLSFLKNSVEAWVIDLEDAWSELIAQPQVVKFNTDALLRMDAKTRNEVHEIRLRNRLATVNEIRRIEDEAPFADPEFDQPGLPAVAVQPSLPFGGAGA
jgi:HK97 family phage portal protein